jgi:3-methyladenine DNA glycosylase AlkC
MQQVDLVELAQAAQRLESTNLAMRISHLLGMPIEKALSALPGHWSTVVSRITRTALEKALDGALYSLKHAPRKPANKIHKALAGVSGAVGGTFGIAALAVELPVSATIMLRSIADIARSHGEDLDDLDSKMACLTVFALSGGSANSQESADTSYYAVRSFLSKAIGDTANHVAVHGFSKEGAPALVKLVNAVATRFSIPVSQKLATQTIPAIGAVGGASVNLLFMEHYQQMARAHFTVRRLERQFGKKAVEKMYKEIVQDNARLQRKKWTVRELLAS